MDLEPFDVVLSANISLNTSIATHNLRKKQTVNLDSILLYFRLCISTCRMREGSAWRSRARSYTFTGSGTTWWS